MAVPHSPQNRPAPTALHAGQRRASAAPHDKQNLPLSGFSDWQATQRTDSE
jgi:hypothetical protein